MKKITYKEYCEVVHRMEKTQLYLRTMLEKLPHSTFYQDQLKESVKGLERWHKYYQKQNNK